MPGLNEFSCMGAKIGGAPTRWSYHSMMSDKRTAGTACSGDRRARVNGGRSRGVGRRLAKHRVALMITPITAQVTGPGVPPGDCHLCAGAELAESLVAQLESAASAGDLSRAYVDGLRAELAASPVHETPAAGCCGDPNCKGCTRSNTHRVKRVAATLAALYDGRLSTTMLPKGCLVRTHGLVSKPAQNGVLGTVVGYNPQVARYAVLIGSNERLGVKSANLTREYESVNDFVSPRGRRLLLSPMAISGYLKDENSIGFGHLRTSVVPAVGQRFELCVQHTPYAQQCGGFSPAEWPVFGTVIAVAPEPADVRPATVEEVESTRARDYTWQASSLEMKVATDPVADGEVVLFTGPGPLHGLRVRVVGPVVAADLESLSEYAFANGLTEPLGPGYPPDAYQIPRAVMTSRATTSVVPVSPGDTTASSESLTGPTTSTVVGNLQRIGPEHIPAEAIEAARARARAAYGMLHGQVITCETDEPLWPACAGVRDAATLKPVAAGSRVRFQLRANDWMGCMWELVPRSVHQPRSPNEAAAAWDV